jgi:MerR family redox-sensitive transcriptional activator SoxR
MTIGEVAERSGIPATALRYYESRGLIAPDRTHAGHRRYPRSVLRRLAFIVFAQRVGLTLGEIERTLATLPHDRTPTRADWATLSEGWSTRVDEAIADLERIRDALTTCIGCGCLSLDRCALANPDDRAGQSGSGPLVLRKSA